ncbi:MAG: hypothetical protein HWD90_13435 [Campylobacteraceae bacterium]|nr:hypothetical protein [Campylobacteraceae bacterium]
MKKCSVYFDMGKNDFFLTSNENNNFYYLTRIRSLKDICENVNSSEKMNLENHKFLFSFELTCQVESDDIASQGPKIQIVKINKNLKKIIVLKEVISKIKEKRNELTKVSEYNKSDLFILNLIIRIFSIFLIFISIQNNKTIPASEYSKIDIDSDAFKSLDSDIQNTITNYINEESDKIVNAALEEDKQKQIQYTNSDLKF